jgi:hypothetical protein
MPRSLVVAAALAFLVAGAAHALPTNLALNYSFHIDTAQDGVTPEGLAFTLDGSGDPEIFVVDKNSNNIVVYKQDATDLVDGWSPDRSFAGPVGALRGLDFLPNGNLMASGNFSVVEVSPVDGSTIGGGISFSNFSFSEIEAAVYVNANSIYLGGDGNGDQIVHVDSSGNAVDLPGLIGVTSFLHGDVNGNGVVDSSGNADLHEPNYDETGGAAYDPTTNLLYFVDDSSGSGRSRVFVYDLSGNLLSVSDPLYTQWGWGPNAGSNDPTIPDEPVLVTCTANNGFQCTDPEGLAFGVVNGQGHLLFAFESEQVITGVLPIPEPGVAMLVGLGVLHALRSRSARRSV